MANILVSLVHKDEDGYVFEVHVRDPDSETRHRIEMSEAQYKDLNGSGRLTPEALVEKSFQFLLSKEPKESILPVFHLTDVTQYFPDYREFMEKF